MERKQIIGLMLIFLTLFVWNLTFSPSKDELNKKKHQQDSIALAAKVDTSAIATATTTATDTTQMAAPATGAAAETVSIENDVLKLDFSTKGGFVQKATLKKYFKTDHHTTKPTNENVALLEDKKNVFSYNIPMKNGQVVASKDLIFTYAKDGNKLVFSTVLPDSTPFQQTYSLSPNDYTIDYAIQSDAKQLALTWVNYTDKIEPGVQYEQSNTSVFFKEKEEKSADYCKCAGNDLVDLPNKNIQWVANTNQFFNTSFIPKNTGFTAGKFQTSMTDFKTSEDLKRLQSDLVLDLGATKSFGMTMYIGPNDYKKLESLGTDLEQLIPYGSSIFGTINRHVIRPFFDMLAMFISNKGIVIILIIFLIKMLLYPLLYKTLHSQAKMAALKPELDVIKAKHKDDMQAQQVESMKVYQEYGVSPFSGCLPMLLQMPIWIALYRFFPASFTFRQESFLWANDLSTFDPFFQLPFSIPFMGDHLSLFTLLWAISTVVYTYYSTKNVDMSANPAMKYVQYIMPLMFLGFFNSYAAGLTSYMFFSNLINILQTIFTKKFIFDDKKIRAELEVQKSKPKKKSGFSAKLEEAMKMQQQMQADKNKGKK